MQEPMRKIILQKIIIKILQNKKIKHLMKQLPARIIHNQGIK